MGRWRGLQVCLLAFLHRIAAFCPPIRVTEANEKGFMLYLTSVTTPACCARCRLMHSSKTVRWGSPRLEEKTNVSERLAGEESSTDEKSRDTNNASTTGSEVEAGLQRPPLLRRSFWRSWLLDDKGHIDSSRALNLALLLASAISALGLIFTVDMDIWRGWELSEILLRIPYDNWQEYEGGLTNNPVLVKTVINVVIYLVGDWMAQVNWGRDRSLVDFDLARTARNGLIGAFFGPLVAYYYEFSDFILPMDIPVNRVLKILMDQSIYFITKCSMYIAMVGLLRGDELEQVYNDVRQKLVPIVLRGWRFWPLAHIITYGVIPPRHRVLYVNAVDILWSAIVAGLASAPPPPPPSDPLPPNAKEGEADKTVQSR